MKKYITLIALLMAALSLSAQNNVNPIPNYINLYNQLAINEMRVYKIPASITLAQGILESNSGTSDLVRRSNNHFGIKANNGWTGPVVLANDDAPNERFRKYNSANESYRDHSLFLTQNARYHELFQLSITDYRGWANGLRRAGYATNPEYAIKLIGLIEQYQLTRYDRMALYNTMNGNMHDTYINNGLLYVRCMPGDTWKTIGKEFHIKKRKLRKYNDLYKGYTLQENEVVYLEKKYDTYHGNQTYHVLQPGESMHSVSQMYGIRLKKLYKLNGMKKNYPVPPVGTMIWLK